MSKLTLKKPTSRSKQDLTDVPEVRATLVNMGDKKRRAHREDETSNVKHGDKSFPSISFKYYYNQNWGCIDIDESQLIDQILSFFPASREWRGAWTVWDNLVCPIDLVGKSSKQT